MALARLGRELTRFAFQPGPEQALYCATTAHVLSITEALAEEARASGVHVCCLAPGPTETRFGATADMLDTRLFRMGATDAARVARGWLRRFRRGKVLVVPGLRNRLIVFSVRLSPRGLARKASGFLQT